MVDENEQKINKTKIIKLSYWGTDKLQKIIQNIHRVAIRKNSYDPVPILHYEVHVKFVRL